MIFSRGQYSFRAVEETDLEFLAEHRNQEETYSRLSHVWPVMKHRQKEWLDSLGHDSMYFIGYYETTPVAFLRVNEIDLINRTAAVGMDMFESFRGHGHSKHFMQLLVLYCFSMLNLERLWLLVMENNERAINTYEGVGFKREGVLRGHLLRYGKRWDYVAMGLLMEGTWE